MERAFNFKLLVPPRTNISQVSAVKPQESGPFDDTSTYVPPVQGFIKCYDKDASLPFTNTNMVLPTKSPRTDVAQKIAVMPMEKESPVRSSQIYSKLLEEAEKIKAWKIKMVSDIVHKDRLLQENKRTIATQRKAIQELQFENESLSMKLEERLYENEDLQNKNNVTRNLCTILKDTFERSAEKMSLFEAEREETHDLFMQNHQHIQRLVAEFENLRLQAEADKQELLTVKEGLKQCDDLKLRFEKDYHIKEEEVFMLNEKLKEKESELKDLQLNFQVTQLNLTALQESAKQQLELLKTCEQEQKELQEKLKKEEQVRQEIEENQKCLLNTLEETKKEYIINLQESDIKFEDINKVKEQLAHELEEVHKTKESLHSSLTAEKMRVQELESEHSSLTEELRVKNTELGSMSEANKQQDIQIQTLKNEMETRLNSIKYLEEKKQTDDEKMIQLIAEHAEKQAEINELKIKLQEIEGQLSEALNNKQELFTNTELLKNDLRQSNERYDDLLEKFHQLNHKKNTVQKQISASENKVLEICLKESKASEEKLKITVKKLEDDKQQLQKQVDLLTLEIKEHNKENENIQGQLKDSNKYFQNKQMKKQKQIKALELKLTDLKTKLETKEKSHEECLKENKALKEQVVKRDNKCLQHNTEFAELKEELQKQKDRHEKQNRKICLELEDKSASETELKLEVEKLKKKATEAIKNKEDSDIKCQQKISDMVTLMERHKHEYDKMVEEKDAELSEKRMQEAEVNANKTSLELELSHIQVENKQLIQQLEEFKLIKKNMQQDIQELTKTQISQKNIYTKKEQRLEQEIVALKKQIKSLKGNDIQKLSETINKNKHFETPETATTKMSTRLRKAETETPLRKSLATPISLDNNLPTSSSWTLETKTGSTPRIKSFRVRTPPSSEKTTPWRKNILELDPKSDSSERSDILGFSAVPLKAKKPQKDFETMSLALFKKVQSSAGYKSPGAALKLATMKRMRDAGWTTVTSSDKKKKKITEKIFA